MSELQIDEPKILNGNSSGSEVRLWVLSILKLLPGLLPLPHISFLIRVATSLGHEKYIRNCLSL